MPMWYDKKTNYYDSGTQTLYLEAVFGMGSFITTPIAILANIDDPYVFFFYVAFGLGLLGLILAVVNIIRAVRSGSTRGIPFSVFGLVASLLGIAIAVLAYMKFAM